MRLRRCGPLDLPSAGSTESRDQAHIDAAAQRRRSITKSVHVCSSRVLSPSDPANPSLQGMPVFVDTSSKGDLIPTVYALWRAPGILPVVQLKHHSITHFILGARASRTVVVF